MIYLKIPAKTQEEEPPILHIGRMGENEAEEVVFDIGIWIERYGGSGYAALTVQRDGDAYPYPRETVREDEKVIWSIGEVDTALPGEGRCELSYTVGETVVKSQVLRVRVEQSLSDASDPPEPYEAWLETLTALAAETEGNAVSAAESAAAAATFVTLLPAIPVVTSSEVSAGAQGATLTENRRNLRTGTITRNEVARPIAASSQAGLMLPTDVDRIAELISRMDAQEGTTVRLLYDLAATPSSERVAAFVTQMGYTEDKWSSIAVVIYGTFHIWHYYVNSEQWQDDGVDTVSQATNASLGIVRGSATAGKCHAEADGTLSLVGYDALVQADAGKLDADALNTENWTFTLEDGTTVTNSVALFAGGGQDD